MSSQHSRWISNNKERLILDIIRKENKKKISFCFECRSKSSQLEIYPDQYRVLYLCPKCIEKLQRQ